MIPYGTLLMMAVQNNKANLTKFLLAVGGLAGFDVNDAVGDITPLHAAVSYGLTSAMMVLIKAGCDVEAENQEGCSPLYVACIEGHYECAVGLIAAGADVNNGGNAECWPLCGAVNEGCPKLTRLLLDNGADANGRPGHKKRDTLLHDTWTPLKCNLACGFYGDYDERRRKITKMLVKAGAYIEEYAAETFFEKEYPELREFYRERYENGGGGSESLLNFDDFSAQGFRVYTDEIRALTGPLGWQMEKTRLFAKFDADVFYRFLRSFYIVLCRRRNLQPQSPAVTWENSIDFYRTRLREFLLDAYLDVFESSVVVGTADTYLGRLNRDLWHRVMHSMMGRKTARKLRRWAIIFALVSKFSPDAHTWQEEGDKSTFFENAVRAKAKKIARKYPIFRTSE